MSKKVKNNLQNVEIGGDYVGGDSNQKLEKNSKPSDRTIKAAIITFAGTIIAALIISGVFFSKEDNKEMIEDTTSSQENTSLE
ncbi:hypothetical protein N9O56_01430 [Rickettsiales bacterium]|nr:hypothetical protein [Rickettsiales bacterium]